jgi:hypothetical protein
LSLKLLGWTGACAGVAVAGALAWMTTKGGLPREFQNTNAIQGILQAVIPAHNDVFFEYVLENRTGGNFRIADASDVRILAKSRSTGRLMPESEKHLSGEFPLTVPPGRKAHFAVIWTGEKDVDPAEVDDFVRKSDAAALVIFDNARRYQIELPARPVSGK